jgi:hypothetical protein
MKKILITIGIVAVVLIAGFYAFNAYIYQEKQGDNDDITSYRGTLSGEVVCLPHADTSGPTTMECAYGLRTDVGEHYALDLNLMSQEAAPLETGERITANGLITPIEMLSSDHWKTYDIEGIFSVTDSLVRL